MVAACRCRWLYGARRRAAPRLLSPGMAASRARCRCPVVVVGNLTVGGTGKTPLVCWLVVQLAARGLKPGVVTRGYGGIVAQRAADRVRPTIRRWSGDEPLLLARRTGVPVAIGRDRPAAAQLLVERGLRRHRERRWAAASTRWRAIARWS